MGPTEDLPLPAKTQDYVLGVPNCTSHSISKVVIAFFGRHVVRLTGCRPANEALVTSPFLVDGNLWRTTLRFYFAGFVGSNITAP